MALLAGPACTRKLAVDVTLAGPESPDPFDGVTRVRLSALWNGQVVSAGEGRWDQGPLELPTLVAPEVERVVVEGLGADGRLVSSGASGPLDLLHAPPDGPVELFFTRVGALSVAGRTTPRHGGAAVQLADDRVLFAGGTGDDGCTLEGTALYEADARTPRVGPPFPEGRAGELHLLALGDGTVLALGGAKRPACGALEAATQVAVLDPSASTGRLASAALPAVRAGAAVLAVSDSLVIVAGGDDATRVSTAVERLAPRTFELQPPGQLDLPRAEAAAALVSGARVLLAGGRSRLGDDSALADAVVFDPGRGSGSAARFSLGSAVVGAAASTTLAGGVLLAGGRDGEGRAVDRIRALVVQPERSQTYGDTSTVTALPAASTAGTMIDLQDGTFLHLPREPGVPPARVGLLPAAAEALELPPGVEGPLVGGRVSDGTAVLHAEDGTVLVYNPGPAGVLGIFGVEALFAGAPARGAGLGLVPFRPAAWRFEDGRLFGRILPGVPVGGLRPGELLVFGRTRLGDFDARFELELGPLSQASFVFALEDGEHDSVAFLGGLTLVARTRARAAERPLACDSRETPSLTTPGPHPVRVRRAGAEVRVDIGDDGSDELVCATPGPVVGLVGFGVITGEASLSKLSVDVESGG